MADIDVDVLVVGAGPGGLFAAARLARDGHRVLVCEEHQTRRRSGALHGHHRAESFDEFQLPRTSILNPLRSRPVRLAVRNADRLLDDEAGSRRHRPRHVRSRAGGFRAGPPARRSRPGTRVGDLTAGANGVTARAGERNVRARLVVLACGASYGVQRRLAWGCRASTSIPRSASCRRARSRKSRCISAATSRRAGSPGPCRSFAGKARTFAWASWPRTTRRAFSTRC